MCYFSSHTLLLGLPFFSYTKLDLICRNKYCCSKSINLGTKFAGHSCIKSSKGELLHRSVRLERKLIYQVNWELGSQKGAFVTIGVIKPTNSPYNSPIFVVPKKDGSPRYVLDFRKLNANSHTDKYSMKSVEEWAA